MVEVQRTRPRRFSRNWGHLNGLSGAAVAMLIDRGLLDGYPLEATLLGLQVIHGAPASNVYRCALLGDGEGLTEHLPAIQAPIEDQAATSLPTTGE